ncbi:hypothetical protein [Cryptosporangium phraense]|uniref:Uncharacterized protein n=1 Tax=Cryptosporangium phraense TaxID=2593070 RepID=A0A545AI60_9ACTN|nr:hypothetical protein [Cryptosporangium phraense]TQS41002.1 hypothetical protein FL583_32005 [Cryptosporangium phraense]
MTYNPPPPGAAGPPPPLPGQAPRGPRPATVTMAAYVLVGEAVLLLLGAVVSLLAQDTIKEATDKYLDDQNLTSSSTNGTASQVFGIVFGLIFAAAFIGLALGVLRGANVARIIAWVVSGLALCCVGVSTAFSLAVISKYLPGGYLAYSYLVTFLELAGFVAIIVLLALPASNAYFRKPAAGY